MFKVDLKDFYDALCSCQTLTAAKEPSALIKVHSGVVDVCMSDGYRNFIKRMDIITDADIEDIAFIVNLDKIIPILSNYIPVDGFDADLLKIEKVDNIIELSCSIKYSESKFDESLAGKLLNELSNKIAVEGTDNSRFSMLCRPDYGKLLEVAEDADTWSTATLKENISRLIIDKGTKAVYMSGSRGLMFATGSNQVNIINIDNVTHSFHLETTTAKSISSVLSKFGNELLVSTSDGGRYVTIVDKDLKNAVWTSCVKPNQGDVAKLDLYTNGANYEDYRSIICKSGLMIAVNAVACSDKADSQQFQIVDVAGSPKIRLNSVVAGGSVSSTFDTEFAAFEMKEGITEGIKGTVVVSTLKNILSDCKGVFVKLKIEIREGYSVIRVSDVDAEGNELSVYFTVLNTR